MKLTDCPNSIGLGVRATAWVVVSKAYIHEDKWEKT